MIREEFDIDYYRSSLSKALPDCLIQAQLEQGGQGIVFHAWHEVAKRDLAVKVLAGGAFASTQNAKRFRREVELMSKMHHPNIVPTYDCGVFDGGLWYAMKFIEGIEVSGWQVIERPTERRCVELFMKVCNALGYAHSAGYIHRDIKPNNIQVDAEDNPFILDFGLARPIPGKKRDDASAAGHPAGTLKYMSPEQVIGEELLGVQTDIYSLGVVMYEVLSGGRMPYPTDGDAIERRGHIIETQPANIRGFNPGIDRDLSSIVSKCLEKHAAERYDSMDALKSDLHNWLTGDAVAARAGNHWYRLKKAARRHKWPLIAASIFVVMLLAGSTTTAMMYLRSQDQAATYQAGLKIYDLVQRGSEANEEDRTDVALALWHEALELDAAAPVRNPEIDRMSYEVLHRICEFHLIDKHTDLARGYCTDALAVAEQYAEDSDPGWQRRMGFAEILRGRVALADIDHEAALSAFARAVEIRRELVRQDPESANHKGRLAVALALAGRATRGLGLSQDTLVYYSESYTVRLELYDADPDSPKRSIDLVQSEAKLGLWHLVQNTDEDNVLALQWIDRARSRLTEMQADGRCADQSKGCGLLSDDLTKNRRIVQRRLEVTP